MLWWRFRATARAAGVVLAMLAVMPASALSQTAEEDSVVNRPRPGVDPIGIELDEVLGFLGLVSKRSIEKKDTVASSFTVFPSFAVSGSYESNVFRADVNPVSDRVITYTPGIAVQSDWGRHNLAVSASASIGRHDRRPGEDFEDVQLQLNGSLDIHDNKSLSLVTGISREHVSRGTEDDPGSDTPPRIFYSRFADLAGNYDGNPVTFRFDLDLEHEDHQSGGGIDNSVNNVFNIDLTTRFGYEFVPGTTLFLEPAFDWRLFDHERDGQGLLQNNGAVGALFGITWDVSGVTFAEFGAGVTHRSYDEPSFQSQTNLDFTGRLIWNATDLLSVSADLGRSTSESSTPGESGVLNTNFETRVDFEVLDNVVLNGSIGLSRSENQETDRTDDDFTLSFGVLHLINEAWSLTLSVESSTRQSNVDSNEFDNVTATIGLSHKI